MTSHFPAQLQVVRDHALVACRRDIKARRRTLGIDNSAEALGDPHPTLWTQPAPRPDGRVIVEGGECNFEVLVESTEGAIYNPVTDSWTQVNTPGGWSTIGDSPAVVLADGTFMMGQAAPFPKSRPSSTPPP